MFQVWAMSDKAPLVIVDQIRDAKPIHAPFVFLLFPFSDRRSLLTMDVRTYAEALVIIITVGFLVCSTWPSFYPHELSVHHP